MLLITVLGSNSSGNCYLVQSPESNETLMLDAGVSFKEIQKAMNYKFNNLVGVLITHEHGDHIKSVEKLASAGIDIYASNGTFDSKELVGHRYVKVEELKEFVIGNFKVLSFKTQHDAAEPFGFLIEYMPSNERILYATDTFYLKYKFKDINYFLIECNYTEEIVKKNLEIGVIEKTRYKRLLRSHMSLENCIEFLRHNVSIDTKKIVLIHLSDENSDEKKMVNDIYDVFHVETIAARNGEIIRLQKYPF